MIKNLEKTAILAYTDEGETGLVLSAQPWVQDTVKVTYARTDDLQNPETTTELDPSMRLGAAAAHLFGPTDKRLTLVALPPLKWPRPRGFSFVLVLVLMLAAAVTVALVLGGEAIAPMLLAAVGVGFAAAGVQALRSKHPTQILTPGRLQLDGPDLVEHSRARLAGQSPGSPSERLAEARESVDEIREEFGLLSTDIVYRIDYPALFDTAVPATEQFHAALIRFDNATGLPVGKVEDLAAEVEVAYAVARDNAETVGHRHLPEAARDDARRAADAARLAQGAGTEGERVAAMTQVQRILDSLALYYLPTIDAATLAIEPPGPADE